MSRKVSVTLPDEVYEAAAGYAKRDARTVANLCAFATALYVSKYAPYHKRRNAVPVDRNGAPARPRAESVPVGKESAYGAPRATEA